MGQLKALGQRCEWAVEAALRAGAADAEVICDRSRQMEVGLQKDDLDQVQAGEELVFGVRVFVDGRLGFATGNQPGALQALAEEAVAIARAAPPDPAAHLPDGHDLGETADVDPELLSLIEGGDAGGLVELTMTLLRELKAADGRVNVDSGGLYISELQRVIRSSRGVSAGWWGLEAGGSVFGMAVDGPEVGSFSYDGDRVRRLSELRPRMHEAFGRFRTACVGALGAGKGESFRGTLVVPPEAVDELLLGTLLGALSGEAVRSGRSPFGQRLGEAIATSRLSLFEAGSGLCPEPASTGHSGDTGFSLAPFDREGQPRHRRALVDGGVLRGLLFDSLEGRRANGQSTANAAGGAASIPQVGAGSVELAPGDLPMAELEKVDKGVLLSRFSGSIDGTTGAFSGVVKGGFLLSGGERRAIQETAISGNVYDALRSISAITRERHLLNGTRRLPGLRIEDVSITAG
jgi:PmbA protein